MLRNMLLSVFKNFKDFTYVAFVGKGQMIICDILFKVQGHAVKSERGARGKEGKTE